LKEVSIFVSGVAIFRSGCVEGGVRNSGLLLIYGREGDGEREVKAVMVVVGGAERMERDQ